MTPANVSERVLEEVIECVLLRWGPDACAESGHAVQEIPSAPYGDGFAPGGYLRRDSKIHYDRDLCLLPPDVIDFLVATQPRTWARLKQHHGAEVRARFLKRLSKELERRGALDVFRKGVKDSGCKFQLAYFRPASGLNEETRRLHAANLFSVVRQLRYSARTEQSLDLVLCLNGIPFFTAELKNPLTGQDVQDAIRQYRNDRDSREPLLARGRCLAHFAVDPDLVYVTTRLEGPRPGSCLSTGAGSAGRATRPSPRRGRDTPPITSGARCGPGTACSI